MTKGERIKHLREAKGMTQTELAEIIGSTKQNVYKYENNIITNIPSDKIERIASSFGVSPGAIMGWDSEESKTKNDSSIECTVSVANIDRVKTQMLIVEQKLSELKDAIEELNKMSVEIEIQ